MTYVGSIRYPADELPDVIELEGWLYKRVERPTSRTPEDGMAKVVR